MNTTRAARALSRRRWTNWKRRTWNHSPQAIRPLPAGAWARKAHRISLQGERESQPRFRRLHRTFEWQHALRLRLAPVDLVAARDVEVVQVLPAEARVREPLVLRLRDDRVHPPRLVEYLQPHVARHVHPPLGIDRHPVSAALRLVVRHLK